MEREDIEGRGDKGVNSSAGRSNWVSWLFPIFVLVNISVFVVEMYVNNCPKRIRNRDYSFGVDDDKCVARFLGRFSFQPLRENPLFGPSSSALDKMGALNWAKVVHQNQSWRLISCMVTCWSYTPSSKHVVPCRYRHPPRATIRVCSNWRYLFVIWCWWEYIVFLIYSKPNLCWGIWHSFWNSWSNAFRIDFKLVYI